MRSFFCYRYHCAGARLSLSSARVRGLGQEKHQGQAAVAVCRLEYVIVGVTMNRIHNIEQKTSFSDFLHPKKFISAAKAEYPPPTGPAGAAAIDVFTSMFCFIYFILIL